MIIGTKTSTGVVASMSALNSEADIRVPHRHVRLGPQADSCTATSGNSNAAEPPDHDLPARGKSHPINFWYGSRRNFWDGSRRWNSFCWAAFLANAATCSSVCRFSFGRAIHSRMIFWARLVIFHVRGSLGYQSVTVGRVRDRGAFCTTTWPISASGPG